MRVSDPSYLLLGLLILALIVAGPMLRSWLGRRAAEAGRRVDDRYAAEKLEGALRELGTTLVIDAPEPLARRIVDEAVAGGRRDYRVGGDGRYGIRYLEADDTIAELVPVPGGTLFRVETFREYLGFPQTASLWRDLRTRVAAAAENHRATVSPGPPTAYARGDLVDDRDARWTRAG